MNELENAVAEAFVSEEPVDNAQDTEVSVEDIMQESNEAEESETAVHGDSDHAPEAEEHSESDSEKTGRRIKAALDGQRKKFRPDLDYVSELDHIADGMSRDEIKELVRAEKARRMHEEDPEISEKAARQILTEREKAPRADSSKEKAAAGISELVNRFHWTRSDLEAFVADEDAMEAINNGEDVVAAAFAWKNESMSSKPVRKRGVPTARSTAAGATPDFNDIENMTDEQFAAFDKRLQAAARAGKRVRL